MEGRVRSIHQRLNRSQKREGRRLNPEDCPPNPDGDGAAAVQEGSFIVRQATFRAYYICLEVVSASPWPRARKERPRRCGRRCRVASSRQSRAAQPAARCQAGSPGGPALPRRCSGQATALAARPIGRQAPQRFTQSGWVPAMPHQVPSPSQGANPDASPWAPQTPGGCGAGGAPAAAGRLWSVTRTVHASEGRNCENDRH